MAAVSAPPRSAPSAGPREAESSFDLRVPDRFGSVPLWAVAGGALLLAMAVSIFVRTRYTLLSPEWTASEAEAGLTVYAVPNTPVVLLSVNGRTVSASLKDNP